MAFSRYIMIKDSALINQMGYDPIEHTLRIWFSGSNSVWDYYNVPEDVVGSLVCHGSIGRMFNAKIRGKFKSGQVIESHVNPAKATKSKVQSKSSS